ncbi:MAG: hypothetical protein BWY95_00421 [Bacteroidetes bacterium ADurb.BinA104]|nr:MAG: hypothetical protein BWY95_00421 [Bacteroidetes bacterium ADurb.BinA104]
MCSRHIPHHGIRSHHVGIAICGGNVTCAIRICGSLVGAVVVCILIEVEMHSLNLTIGIGRERCDLLLINRTVGKHNIKVCTHGWIDHNLGRTMPVKQLLDIGRFIFQIVFCGNGEVIETFSQVISAVAIGELQLDIAIGQRSSHYVGQRIRIGNVGFRCTGKGYRGIVQPGTIHTSSDKRIIEIETYFRPVLIIGKIVSCTIVIGLGNCSASIEFDSIGRDHGISAVNIEVHIGRYLLFAIDVSVFEVDRQLCNVCSQSLINISRSKCPGCCSVVASSGYYRSGNIGKGNRIGILQNEPGGQSGIIW